MPPRSILVVEDERDLADLVSYNLRNQGYDTLIARDGKEALRVLEQQTPAAIILDVMLPHFSGIEIARHVRADARLAKTPILMLTAKGAEEDQIEGLRAGADDYVTKPFSVPVLLARVDAIFRRNGEAAEPTPAEPALPNSIGPISVDEDIHEASVDGVTLKLTLTEFRILACLVRAQGRVMSRADLIVNAIGPGITVTERTIDVHVASIRKKITPYGDSIITVRGVGYRLVEAQPARD